METSRAPEDPELAGTTSEDDWGDDNGGTYEWVAPEGAGAAGGAGGAGEEDDAGGAATPSDAGYERFEPARLDVIEEAPGGGAGDASEEQDSEREEEEGDAAARGMSVDQARQLAELRLRQLEKEYTGTAGAATDAAPDAASAAVAAADPKAKKLAELRARLAAARAAASGLGSSEGRGRPVMPTMELAAGATEFPADYDEGCAADTAVLASRAASSGPGAAAGGKKKGAAAAAGAKELPPFDPFGTPAPALAPRAVSPLADGTKAAIQAAMSRISITPRWGPGGPGAHAEALAQAALARGKAQIAAYTKQ